MIYAGFCAQEHRPHLAQKSAAALDAASRLSKSSMSLGGGFGTSRSMARSPCCCRYSLMGPTSTRLQLLALRYSRRVQRKAKNNSVIAARSPANENENARRDYEQSERKNGSAVNDQCTHFLTEGCAP